MNYIQRLQTENRELMEQLESIKARILELDSHIQLPKYCGHDERDGQSNAWISTRDVANWTHYILQGN